MLFFRCSKNESLSIFGFYQSYIEELLSILFDFFIPQASIFSNGCPKGLDKAYLELSLLFSCFFIKEFCYFYFLCKN